MVPRREGRERRERPAIPLVARGLGVRYPGRRAPALDAVDLEIEPGERVLVAGPSGSGKSTLALSLAGLIPLSVEAEQRGTVSIDGNATSRLLPGAAAERVGIVFQDPASQFTMPGVEDEVAFGLENLGRQPNAMLHAVEAALRAVGLLDRRGWPIERLSGGQQQRVALAATLAMDPGALVLDEPAAHLDPRSADALYAWIRRLGAGRERTVVAVEHALDRIVAGLVDRCIVLDAGGRIAVDGPIGTVFGSEASARRCRRLGVWLPASVRLAMLLGPDGAAGPLPLDVDAAAGWIAADPGRARRLRDAATVAGGGPPSPAGPVVLEARNVTVRYRSPAGDQLAVRDASLAVRGGELVALVGPNGSGKSTLLRALSGVAPLERGEVVIGGTDPTRAGPDPRLVGHVFQNPEAGFLGDTVRDEVAYGPRALGWPDAKIAQATAAILERFGLAALAGANPFTLSQGQKRRLSIAAATIVRPRLLILDEPTFGQDARSAAALFEEIAAIRRDGTAIVIATHDIELVAEVSNRLIAMVGGATIADSTPPAFLADDALLDATAQVRPPLQRILAAARSQGADVPVSARWADVERFVALQSKVAPAVMVAGGGPDRAHRAGGTR